jgi:hypothetical protein
VPELVNKMTPDVQAPPDDESSLLESLTGLLGGR